MKTGKIVLKDEEYFVEYSTNYGRDRQIPVFKPDSEFVDGETVDFEIVDEFTHPRLFIDVPLFEGTDSARIIKRHSNA
jgi:hypothetical protein